MESLRREEHGVVTVDFMVGVDGSVTKATLSRSSGFPSLDKATLIAVERCRVPQQVADKNTGSGWDAFSTRGRYDETEIVVCVLF